MDLLNTKKILCTKKNHQAGARNGLSKYLLALKKIFKNTKQYTILKRKLLTQ